MTGWTSDFSTIDNVVMNTFVMLFGEVNVATFQQRNVTTATVLFILFMVMGVIVMLNVLIAMVADSYDKAQSLSRHLFLVYRLELAAELMLVLPSSCTRDADFEPTRGKMLLMLFEVHDSRRTGQLLRIGGPCSFVSADLGYGAGGWLLLLGGGSIFLPLTVPYFMLRLATYVFTGGSERAMARLDPEALLATPRAHADDNEWLGRHAEIVKLVENLLDCLIIRTFK